MKIPHYKYYQRNRNQSHDNTSLILWCIGDYTTYLHAYQEIIKDSGTTLKATQPKMLAEGATNERFNYVSVHESTS